MADNYKVLSIDEMTRVNAAKTGIEKYYHHRVQTKGGVVISVDIDEKNFTAAKAQPILEKAATEADKILAL